ncbi:HNH endonuclease [Peribacillus sp. NPDC101480]|uniref:HNH endonuclease n=1 Tax=Peribacillus sp. NPDC101480 TaxID=3390620 RepID=UPI003D007E85
MASKKKFCGGCGKRIDVNSVCECRKKAAAEGSKRSKDKFKQNHPEVYKAINSKRWRDKRLHIIRRDKGHCQRCKIRFSLINTDNLEVHHIKAKTLFPEKIFEDLNLITLCRTCNLQLGQNGIDFYWKPEEYEYNL